MMAGGSRRGKQVRTGQIQPYELLAAGISVVERAFTPRRLEGGVYGTVSSTSSRGPIKMSVFEKVHGFQAVQLGPGPDLTPNAPKGHLFHPRDVSDTNLNVGSSTDQPAPKARAGKRTKNIFKSISPASDSDPKTLEALCHSVGYGLDTTEKPKESEKPKKSKSRATAKPAAKRASKAKETKATEVATILTKKYKKKSSTAKVTKSSKLKATKSAKSPTSASEPGTTMDSVEKAMTAEALKSTKPAQKRVNTKGKIQKPAALKPAINPKTTMFESLLGSIDGVDYTPISAISRTSIPPPTSTAPPPLLMPVPITPRSLTEMSEIWSKPNTDARKNYMPSATESLAAVSRRNSFNGVLHTGDSSVTDSPRKVIKATGAKRKGRKKDAGSDASTSTVSSLSGSAKKVVEIARNKRKAGDGDEDESGADGGKSPRPVKKSKV